MQATAEAKRSSSDTSLGTQFVDGNLGKTELQEFPRPLEGLLPA